MGGGGVPDPYDPPPVPPMHVSTHIDKQSSQGLEAIVENILSTKTRNVNNWTLDKLKRTGDISGTPPPPTKIIGQIHLVG